MNLSREISLRIKGVAIILMVMTHVFSLFVANSNYYTISLLNTGITIETIIGRTADICVYLFAFINGFGLCCSYQEKNTKSIVLSTIIKIVKFLLCYWLVIFVIFLPFYVINQGSNFRLLELIKTMFGHHGFFSYGWYVYFYILLLITLPFVSKLLNVNKWFAIAISYMPFIATYLILNRLKSNIFYYDNICVILFVYSAACIGYAFAKYDFLSMIKKLFRNKKWLIMLINGVMGFSIQIVVFGYYGKGVI